MAQIHKRLKINTRLYYKQVLSKDMSEFLLTFAADLTTI